MDSTQILKVTFALIVTYGMHSTLLLGVAWLVDRRRWLKSHLLRESVWKWAATAPFLTAIVQVCWTGATPIWQMELGGGVVEVESPPLSAPIRNMDMAEVVPFNESRPSGSVAENLYVDDEGVSTDEAPVDQAADVVEVSPIKADPAQAVTTSNVTESEAAIATEAEWQIQITPAVKQNTVAVSEDSSRAEIVAGTVKQTDETADGAPSLATMTATLDASQPSERVTAVAESRPAGTVSLSVQLPVLITMAWIFLGLLRLVVTSVRVAVHLRRCVVTPARVQRILRSILNERGPGDIASVVTSPQIREPSACGVFRGIIVLPEGLENRLSDSELSALLCHELGHVMRRDTIWLWGERLLIYCFSWQPLNLLAVKHWQQAAEFQCDDWAAGDTESRIVLARVLTTVAELRSRHSFSPGVPASAPPLSLRVERLLSVDRSPDRWLSRGRRAVLLGLMLAAAVGVSLVAPRLVWADTSGIVAGSITADAEFQPSFAIADDSQMQLLRTEILALTSDLETALELLQQQEQDDEVRHKTEVIQQRLDQLKRAAE